MEAPGLLGVTLLGEARDVHTTFMEQWDPDPIYGEANRRARRAESRKVIWRGYRKQKTAWATMRLNSSLTTGPAEPALEEPEDVEELFHALTQRFWMLTTQHLSLPQGFRIRPWESIYSLLSRFNDVVRALETKEHLMVTVEHITTFYIYYLEGLVQADEAEDLMQRIKDEELIRERYDEAPLIRAKVHKMALEADRSEVVYETKLHSLGLEPRHCLNGSPLA